MHRRLPLRGYDRDFENLLRGLVATRPDLLRLIDRHSIRATDVPTLIYAYNSGRKMGIR